MDPLATRPSWVPQPVHDLANRLGARTDGAAVRLTQHGTMRSVPGARRMKFSAEQTIQLRQPGFEWRASTGPAGCITVIDALQRGSTTSEVRLLGCVRLAGTKPDDAAALLKGQLLRYLAELAWAPDAILQNALLQWSAPGNSLRVAVQHRDVRCKISGSCEWRPKSEERRRRLSSTRDGPAKCSCVEPRNNSRKPRDSADIPVGLAIFLRKRKARAAAIARAMRSSTAR